MKKWFCMLLALALMLGCAGATASEDWPEYHCQQENFTTLIPRRGTASFETETGYYGLRIYLDEKGSVPYLIVNRRDGARKFKNPKNYLNNVYREFLEEKYGDDSRGMNPARAWEVGGKQLIGARYMYAAEGAGLTHLQLIEVRELGDVEYTAVFAAADEERTMEALGIAVQNYREDEAAPEETKEPQAAAAGALVEPLDTAGQEVDLQNGTFWTRLWGIEYLDDGGFFYADLYEEDLYPREAVESLKAGDRVRVEDRVLTVAAAEKVQGYENRIAVAFSEDSSQNYLFIKVDDNYADRDFYHLMCGDQVICHFCTDYQVMMPLPYAFQFAWARGSDVRLWTADDFLGLLRKGTLQENEMTRDRTAIQFRDGLVTAIVHTD